MLVKQINYIFKPYINGKYVYCKTTILLSEHPEYSTFKLSSSLNFMLYLEMKK